MTAASANGVPSPVNIALSNREFSSPITAERDRSRDDQHRRSDHGSAPEVVHHIRHAKPTRVTDEEGRADEGGRGQRNEAKCYRCRIDSGLPDRHVGPINGHPAGGDRAQGGGKEEAGED
jgi:hypothetical protein